MRPAPVQRHHHQREEDGSGQLQRTTIQRHHEEEDTVQAKRTNPPKVASALQRSTGNHRSGCGCGGCRHVEIAPAKTMQRSAHGPGCSCKQCSGVQRKAPAVKRDGSFEADGNLSSQVSKLEGKGRPLPDKVRGDMETRFGANFSGVRVHTGSDAVQMSRSMHADAFTYRRNIAFNAGKYIPASSSGQRLLAHELTHTLQQTGGVQRAQSSHGGNCKCRNCSGVQRKVDIKATRGPAVQRHSSWEHKALGDIKPERLAVIGIYEEMRDKYKEANKKAGLFKKPDPTKVKVQVGEPLNKKVSMADFLHVMTQEIDRLKTFRDHPPTEASAKAEKQLVRFARNREARRELKKTFGKRQYRTKTKQKYELALHDKMREPIPEGDKWQVRLLAVQHRDPDSQANPKPLTGRKTIITYGEMNTLGDFVGNTDHLEMMDPVKLQQVINGIRQQSMIRFMRLRDKVKGKNTEHKQYYGQGFDDTTGSTGRSYLRLKESGSGTDALGKLGSEGGGQLRLIMIDKTKIGQGGDSNLETKYDAGLARNACHFAPESWITWQKYHTEALDLAKQSYVKRYEATQEPTKQGKKTKNTEADDLKSQALIRNGFADHFLQDSYAAGHLINKDEIMKWYQLWLANDSEWKQRVQELSDQDRQKSHSGGISLNDKSGIGSGRRWDYMKDKTSQKHTALVKGQKGLGLEKDRYDINKVRGKQGKNMQAVENMGGTWEGRFGALGLTVPRSLQTGTGTNRTFKRWQIWAGKDTSHVKTTPTEYANAHPQVVTKVDVAKSNFEQFVKDGVAFASGKRWFGAGKGETIYELRKQYQLTDHRTKTDKFLRRDKQLTDVSDDQSYETRAKKGVYKDYHNYMNTAALQVATNVLHDHFCENGLYVQAGNGDKIGKVYGDDAMFKRNSAKGAAYAGVTSNLSRDSVYNRVNAPPTSAVAPPIPATHQSATIRKRFPTHVTDPQGGNAMRFDNWHENGPLKVLCDRVIFPLANRNFFKTFVGGGKAAATSGLTKKISKDITVHQGALF